MATFSSNSATYARVLAASMPVGNRIRRNMEIRAGIKENESHSLVPTPSEVGLCPITSSTDCRFLRRAIVQHLREMKEEAVL